jgi:hypothetical protein
LHFIFVCITIFNYIAFLSYILFADPAFYYCTRTGYVALGNLALYGVLKNTQRKSKEANIKQSLMAGNQTSCRIREGKGKIEDWEEIEGIGKEVKQREGKTEHEEGILVITKEVKSCWLNGRLRNLGLG